MGSRSDFILPPEEIDNLEALRRVARAEKNTAVDRRARLILLLGRDGKTRKEASEIAEISLRTVFLWQRQYRTHGVEALQPRYRQGNPRRLDSEQLQTLGEVIQKGPQAAGYETGAWTSALIADWIRRTYTIPYSAASVRDLLPQLGFSYQFPKKNWQRQTPNVAINGSRTPSPRFRRRSRKQAGSSSTKMKPRSNNREARPKPGLP